MQNALDGRLAARLARYFMQVLDSGSVRGAADILGVDPSVVSRAIGLLERRGRGVQPTRVSWSPPTCGASTVRSSNFCRSSKAFRRCSVAIWI